MLDHDPCTPRGPYANRTDVVSMQIMDTSVEKTATSAHLGRALPLFSFFLNEILTNGVESLFLRRKK